MKVYNKRYKQELLEGNEQDVDGESSDEEDWIVHTGEANGLMDDLGEEFGIGEIVSSSWSDEILITKQRG
jgi:hypothetical protein